MGIVLDSLSDRTIRAENKNRERARIQERIRAEIDRMERMQPLLESIRIQYFDMSDNAAAAWRASHYQDAMSVHLEAYNRTQGCRANELKLRRSERIAQARRILRLEEE